MEPNLSYEGSTTVVAPPRRRVAVKVLTTLVIVLTLALGGAAALLIKNVVLGGAEAADLREQVTDLKADVEAEEIKLRYSDTELDKKRGEYQTEKALADLNAKCYETVRKSLRTLKKEHRSKAEYTLYCYRP